jgi:hypothetical protein
MNSAGKRGNVSSILLSQLVEDLTIASFSMD